MFYFARKKILNWATSSLLARTAETSKHKQPSYIDKNLANTLKCQPQEQIKSTKRDDTIKKSADEPTSITVPTVSQLDKFSMKRYFTSFGIISKLLMQQWSVITKKNSSSGVVRQLGRGLIYLEEPRLRTPFPFSDINNKILPPIQWYVDTKDTSGRGSVRKSGGGVGRLDSANEDGYFYKLNKSRLEKLKKALKEQEEQGKAGTAPTDKNKFEGLRLEELVQFWRKVEPTLK